jgi:hypothetical protein
MDKLLLFIYQQLFANRNQIIHQKLTLPEPSELILTQATLMSSQIKKILILQIYSEKKFSICSWIILEKILMITTARTARYIIVYECLQLTAKLPNSITCLIS